MLQTVPSKSLARRDLKSDPCPQSCWITKIRTTRPAARTASPNVIQYEKETLRYISAQTAMNDTNEEPAYQRLLQRSGFWNPAVASRNSLLSDGVPCRRSRSIVDPDNKGASPMVSTRI